MVSKNKARRNENAYFLIVAGALYARMGGGYRKCWTFWTWRQKWQWKISNVNQNVNLSGLCILLASCSSCSPFGVSCSHVVSNNKIRNSSILEGWNLGLPTSGLDSFGLKFTFSQWAIISHAGWLRRLEDRMESCEYNLPKSKLYRMYSVPISWSAGSVWSACKLFGSDSHR